MGEMSCSCIVLPEFSAADMVTLASFSGVFCHSLGISPLSGLSSVPGPVLSHHPQRRHSSPKSCRWASVTGPALLLPAWRVAEQKWRCSRRCLSGVGRGAPATKHCCDSWYIKNWDVKYGPGNAVNSILITEYSGRWVLGSLGITS